MLHIGHDEFVRLVGIRDKHRCRIGRVFVHNRPIDERTPSDSTGPCVDSDILQSGSSESDNDFGFIPFLESLYLLPQFLLEELVSGKFCEQTEQSVYLGFFFFRCLFCKGTNIGYTEKFGVRYFCCVIGFIDFKFSAV